MVKNLIRLYLGKPRLMTRAQLETWVESGLERYQFLLNDPDVITWIQQRRIPDGMRKRPGTWAGVERRQYQEQIVQALSEKQVTLVKGAPGARPTPYRDGQNVIQDGAGRIVYLPPEAKDVPAMMKGLVGWIGQAETEQPVPVIAGMAHYQFVTIHPYFDGNGRTARALATWVLYRGGYDLGRFYSLEEFYAQDLQGYYEALITHPHHNYYEGRADADITPWLTYFLKAMAAVFQAVAGEVRERITANAATTDPFLRQLDRRGRLVLGLFERQEEITASDAARVLGLSPRQVRNLLNAWVTDGWLKMSDAVRKTRCYRLSAEYRQFIGHLSAE